MVFTFKDIDTYKIIDGGETVGVVSLNKTSTIKFYNKKQFDSTHPWHLQVASTCLITGQRQVIGFNLKNHPSTIIDDMFEVIKALD